jgi:CubicO group peptidase (beta-lactamase class C family)
MSRSGVYHGAAYETRDMGAARPPRGSHPPGAFWYYNNWDFNALGTIYTRLTRESIFEAVEKRIARPIGMEDYEGWRDGRLTYESVSQHPAYVMLFSARDLARFGLLYLNEGAWAGRQVVPSSWVKESTKRFRRFLGHWLRLPVVGAAERLGSRRTRLRGARLPRPGGRRDSVEAPRRGTDRRPA